MHQPSTSVPALIQGLILAAGLGGVIFAFVALGLAAFGDSGQRAGNLALSVASLGSGGSNLIIWLGLSGRLTRPPPQDRI